MNIEFMDPVLPSRRAWLVVLALAALAAVLFAADRLMAAHVHALEDELRARRLAATNPVPLSPVRPAPPYEADALRALDRATLPQAQALGELEAVAVVGIALQSIDVDMAEHQVTVELRSASQAALDDYLDQLNAGLSIPAWRVTRIAADGATAGRLPGPGAPPAAEQAVTLLRHF